MIIALWVIAIAIGGLAYVLYRYLDEVKRAAEVRHDRLEILVERIAKAMESSQQIQRERREEEILKDDDYAHAHETLEERERRWATSQKK